MSETVTVKSFGEGKPWSSGDGKINLTFFETVFDRNGSDFSANWGKKSGEPKVGETIEGEFFEKNGEQRFRIASKPQGGGGSNGGGNGKRDWKPEAQFDPERTARITRSHAQKVAVNTLAGMGMLETKSPDQLESLIRQWTDFYEKDVNEAGQKAIQGAGSRALGGAQADARPAPESSSADERDLYQLLEAAGLNAVAARVVTDYVDGAFTPEQRETAIHRLNDPNQQIRALNKLKELTVKATGEPLPAEVPDDDIPF